MSDVFTDIQFIKRTEKGYADIAYTSNGDLQIDNSFDTAMQIALGTDARAEDTEVTRKELQRGTLVDVFNGFKNGSKLWLLSQSRANARTKNRTVTYAQNALQFLITEGFAKNVTVTGKLKTSGVELNIVIERFTGVFDNYRYEAWNNSMYKS